MRDPDAILLMKGTRSLKDLKSIHNFYIQQLTGITVMNLAESIQSGMSRDRLKVSRCMVCKQSQHSASIRTVRLIDSFHSSFPTWVLSVTIVWKTSRGVVLEPTFNYFW